MGHDLVYLYILHVGWIQGTICYCAIQSTECQLKEWKDDWMEELSFKTPLVDWIIKLYPWGGGGGGYTSTCPGGMNLHA